VTKEVVRDAVLTFEPALDRILAEANRKLAAASAELQSEGGVFVTAFAGILDLGSGAIDYASAGHDSPFLLGGSTGLRRLITDGGPPLGTVDEFRYPIDHDRIELGEVLLLFTDGVTEAENREHRLYSSERLAKALATARVSDARRVVTVVIDDVSRFIGDAEQADDMTLLAVRRVAGYGHAPGAGLGGFGQGIEIGRQPCDLAVAELFFGEGRHHAPRLANRLAELAGRQAASGQIGTEGALPVPTMAVFAKELVARPQGFRAGNIGRRVLRRRGKRQSRQQQRSPKRFHAGTPLMSRRVC